MTDPTRVNFRFRFQDPQDIESYGDAWWTWDEEEIVSLRGRDLILLEETVGLPIVAVLRGARRDETLPKMAAMWIAMHRAGNTVTWAQFDPAVHLTAWEAAPSGPLDSGEDPASDGSSSNDPATAESADS